MLGLRLGFCGGIFRLDSRPSGAGFCEPGKNGKEKNKLCSCLRTGIGETLSDLLTRLQGYSCLFILPTFLNLQLQWVPILPVSPKSF